MKDRLTTAPLPLDRPQCSCGTLNARSAIGTGFSFWNSPQAIGTGFSLWNAQSATGTASGLLERPQGVSK